MRENTGKAETQEEGRSAERSDGLLGGVSCLRKRHRDDNRLWVKGGKGVRFRGEAPHSWKGENRLVQGTR